MLLAIDIGNTAICLAVLKNARTLQVWRIDTVQEKFLLSVRLNPILKVIKKKYPRIQKTVICSVVPNVLKILQPIVRAVPVRGRPLIIGQDIKVPIVNRYNHRQIGQDRLVCAYAAKILYGQPAIVIDLGTAITFDVVSVKGEYLGGAIVPGIRLSAESLYKKTALLPKIKIKGPGDVIGKNTEASILSGIFYGYGALCAGMIELVSKKLGIRPKVILTGGHSLLMKKYIPAKIHAVEPDLVLKGLELLSRF